MTDAIDYLEGYKRGKEMGRREVVEWIVLNNHEPISSGGVVSPVWQAQLKEWGIKNEFT